MLSEQHQAGWYVVGPIQAQCHEIVSCNLIALIKADNGKSAQNQFEIEE